ncbi:hypothetical protein D5086_013667 [Populus alba]|uniref:Uncharacterized protein n=1 Tax=Populus alba TaxID=43335 RepID=A0ACC4C635_POPAL
MKKRFYNGISTRLAWSCSSIFTTKLQGDLVNLENWISQQPWLLSLVIQTAARIDQVNIGNCSAESIRTRFWSHLYGGFPDDRVEMFEPMPRNPTCIQSSFFKNFMMICHSLLSTEDLSFVIPWQFKILHKKPRWIYGVQ